MKKMFLSCIASLIFMVAAQAQNPADSLQKNAGCFVAAKNMKPKVSAVSKTFCVGDKIRIKLKNGKKVNDKISALTQSKIQTVKGREIDVNEILWIKNYNMTTARSLGGFLMMAGGVAVIMSAGSVDFDSMAAVGGLGVGLFAGGILVLSTRTKFEPGKGDTLTFK